MPFDHERLDVYSLALDLLVLADDTIEHLPRGRSHLADQLGRAATSIVLNIAEGAGKFSKPDKRRYYLTAVGSATLGVLGKYLGTPDLQLAAIVFLFGVANLVTGFYFGRTNHQRTGGIGGDQAGTR